METNKDSPLFEEEVTPQGEGKSSRGLFLVMLFSALLSLTASFVLSVDALTLAKNPSAVFSCDLSQVISCGKVGASWQAHLLGFPNAFIGLMCEPVVVTIAVAGLGGVRFPRWFMVTAQGVYFCGLIFAYWLFYEALTVIGALCPWCLCITVGTTLVFFTLLRHNVRQGLLPGSTSSQGFLQRAERLGVLTALPWLLLLAITAIVFLHYGPFLFRG